MSVGERASADERRERRMSVLGKQEQAAIETVAKHFSAVWEKGGDDGPDAYLTIAGKRIALEVASVKRKTAERGRAGKPRLRFDKVVLRLIGDLQAALHEAVPDGQAVIVTVTAPIRLPAKTAAALEKLIRGALARRSKQADVKDTIHGNAIRIRLVTGVARRASKVIGFVHNPDSDPDVFLALTQSLLQAIGAAAQERAPKKFKGERWLVVTDEDGLSPIETYRQVYSQLGMATGFKRILMLLAGGRVESLTE
jgi:hypothetical protein